MAPSSYREDGTRQPRLKLIKVAKYEGLQGLSQLPRISKLREVPLCPGPIGIGSLCVFLQCFCRFAGGDWIAMARRAGGGSVCKSGVRGYQALMYRHTYPTTLYIRNIRLGVWGRGKRAGRGSAGNTA